MMENAQQRLVVAQFGPRAKAYVESVVHAQGADLDALCALIKSRPAHRVLDLGCGGGHVSFSIAPLVEHVTAYDLAPSMLAAAERLAQDRGLTNLSFEQGAVESLPFADQSFDMVVSRYSAHHWSDLARALQEAHRVLTPSGRAIFMDVIAPERPVLDSFLQTLEMLRDPSHVRNYKISEWTRALAAAGFTPGVTTPRRLYLDFASWIARMNTPAPHVAAIRSLQALAAEDVKTHFAVEADSSFTIDTASFEAAA